LGSDDPTLPLDEQKSNRRDQRPGWRMQKVYPVNNDTEDLALMSFPRGVNAAKVVNKAPNGETVFSGALLDDFEIIVTKIEY
jgi:hypothetical protein